VEAVEEEVVVEAAAVVEEEEAWVAHQAEDLQAVETEIGSARMEVAETITFRGETLVIGAVPRNPKDLEAVEEEEVVWVVEAAEVDTRDRQEEVMEDEVEVAEEEVVVDQ